MKVRLARASFHSVVATVALALFASGAALAEVTINLDQPSNTPPPPPPTKSVQQPAPSTSTTSAPKSDKQKKGKKEKEEKKDDKPGKIEGMEVARGDKGYMGVKIENGSFKIRFYDKAKKPVALDVAKAVLRWPVHYQPNDERDLLSPDSDGKSLSSAKIVKPPFSFKLFITLLSDDAGDTPGENYVIDFRQ